MMHHCASLSPALVVLWILTIDQARSLRLPDSKPVHQTLKNIHPTKRQRQALPSRHETFVNQTALTDQQRMDCEPHGDDQVSNMIAHVKQYFNDQSPPPLGDGLSPWQLTLVRSLRFGRVKVGSNHRFRHEEHLSPEEAASEQAYRSVDPQDWLRVLKAAWDLMDTIPLAEHLNKTKAAANDSVLPFAGDSDLDFAILGNVSEDRIDPVMRKFEALLNSNGYPAALWPPDNLKKFQSAVVEEGQRGYKFDWVLPDRWMAVFTDKRQAVGLKYDKELVYRGFGTAFNHAFHDLFPGFKMSGAMSDAFSIVMPHMVMLDFWNPVHAYPFSVVSRHPSRKVLLEGSAFPYPRDWDTKYFRQLTHIIAHDPHGDVNAKKNVRGFCDLYLPNGVWPDDIEATNKTTRLTRACAGQLRSKGFFTFAEQC
eukprot:gnl/TRDRNA2_/TRDRNA2_177727_c1_seq10.p1 gnl/TRDRNA2_/TRDRNA2_177727_c1~~gnl/TRDRNA2_/TRDRNA2_177727_c1_seq10.p1  ORF type:complete len:423 (-),score=37.41 gnl/TRDRNA2_/TRDRNA2_177727_c1_seq10:91-1359(-)